MQEAADKYNSKKEVQPPQGFFGWRKRLLVPVALGTNEAAPVAVLLTEDDTLLRKAAAPCMCRVQWPAPQAPGEDGVRTTEVAATVADLVSRLPDAGDGALGPHPGSMMVQWQHRARVERRARAQGTTAATMVSPRMKELEEHLCLMKFGRPSSNGGFDWRVCYSRMHHTITYQQAVSYFFTRTYDLPERGRWMQLPENEAQAIPLVLCRPDSRSQTETRTPTPSGLAGGQTGDTGSGAAS